MYGAMLCISGLGFPTPTYQEIQYHSTTVCGMLIIGNYYTPKEHAKLKQPQKHNELPEGPLTGPQHTETRVVASLAIIMEGRCILVHLHQIHAPVLPSYACVVLFTYSLAVCICVEQDTSPLAAPQVPKSLLRPLLAFWSARGACATIFLYIQLSVCMILTRHVDHVSHVYHNMSPIVPHIYKCLNKTSNKAPTRNFVRLWHSSS